MKAARLSVVALATAHAVAACQLFLDTDVGAARAGGDAAADTDVSDVGPISNDAADIDPLREGLPSPDSLIVDGAYLTWLEPGSSGRLVRVPIDHWRDENVLATGQKDPYRAIAYGGGLYWTTRGDGLFHRLAATGDVAYGGATNIGGLAGAGDSIYFAYSEGVQGSLSRCTSMECPGRSALAFAESGSIEQLQSTSLGLAWLLSGNTLRGCNTAEIASPNAPYPVVTDPRGITTFASDADFFYVAGARGGIVSLPLEARDGAGALPVLVDARVVISMASDGTRLFFASQDGRISMMSRMPNGAAPVDLAHTTRGPARSLVVSGDHVYWSEGDAIRRARKTP